MVLKKKGNHTAGTRHQMILSKNLLYSNNFIKRLVVRLKKKSGRNNNGHITIRHRGGGAKRLYRTIDWSLAQSDAIIVGTEYDPNRTSFISRIFDLKQKSYRYSLAIKNLYPGSIIKKIIQEPIDIKLGNQLPILYIPSGSIISALGTKKIIYARAAGSSCQLLQKGEKLAKIRIPSGKIIFVPSTATATLGSISNEVQNLQVIGKAGKNRLSGLRPRVRGVAMNPVDHPHGGAGGRPSVTPWGKPTKGKPTKKKKYVTL